MDTEPKNTESSGCRSKPTNGKDQLWSDMQIFDCVCLCVCVWGQLVPLILMLFKGWLYNVLCQLNLNKKGERESIGSPF